MTEESRRYRLYTLLVIWLPYKKPSSSNDKNGKYRGYSWGGKAGEKIIMELFNQPNQFEKKEFLQEKDAIPPWNLNARSQALSSDEILEKLKIVLARLRFLKIMVCGDPLMALQE